MKRVSRRGLSRLLTGALGAAALVGWLSRSRPQAQVAADLVLTNGTILTVDANDSIAQAVAIADGRIVASGTTDAIKPRIGANTRVIDLGVAAERIDLAESANLTANHSRRIQAVSGGPRRWKRPMNS